MSIVSFPKRAALAPALVSALALAGCGGGSSGGGLPISPATPPGAAQPTSPAGTATTTPGGSPTTAPGGTATATPGGGGATSSPGGVSTTAPGSTATTSPGNGGASPDGTYVRFSIVFPAAGAAPSARGRLRPTYISPSIMSLAFTIDGGTPIDVNAPTPTGSPQTVTTTLPIQPGAHTFLVAEYDQQNGAGNLLGRVTETATIVAGEVNTLDFTLNGQLAKIAIQPPSTGFVEGTVAAGLTLVGCAPQTFTAVPQDAGGNTIIMPGAIPALTASSTSALIAVTNTANDQFTVEAPAPFATAVPLTVSGQNLDGTAVTASVNLTALGSFYVADFTAQKVDAFDENGTPLTLPSTAFSNISNPMGLAASPCTSTAPGEIFLTETSNFAYPFVQVFDMAGNTQSLASGAFTFNAGNYVVDQPLFLTDAAGTLVVPDEYSSQISEFTPAGASVTTAAGAFPKLLQPIGVAYDPHDSQLYVTSEGLSTLGAYSNAGALVATATTNSHPMGVVFDSNNDALYVASGGTTGAPLDASATAGQPQPANVAEFSEVPAAVTNTGGFTATSTTAYYTGITYDPYSKDLYVSDAGDSKIIAYTEAGAAVTLATGAFGTISATSAPKGDPMGIVFVP